MNLGILSYNKLGTVMYTCNLSTWEVKAEGRGIQGHSELYETVFQPPSSKRKSSSYHMLGKAVLISFFSMCLDSKGCVACSLDSRPRNPEKHPPPQSGLGAQWARKST